MRLEFYQYFKALKVIVIISIFIISLSSLLSNNYNNFNIYLIKFSEDKANILDQVYNHSIEFNYTFAYHTNSNRSIYYREAFFGDNQKIVKLEDKAKAEFGDYKKKSNLKDKSEVALLTPKIKDDYYNPAKIKIKQLEENYKRTLTKEEKEKIIPSINTSYLKIKSARNFEKKNFDFLKISSFYHYKDHYILNDIILLILHFLVSFFLVYLILYKKK